MSRRLKMTCECDKMTRLFIVAWSLMQLVLVVMGGTESDIASDVATAITTATNLDNQYSLIENEKYGNENMNKWRILDGESTIDNNTNSSMTMPLSRKILSEYNNGLKIVQYDDEGLGKGLRLRQQQLLAMKKRRQLSAPITSGQKITADYGYIEVKDPPHLRITPISLVDINYDESDGEEFYEEMDELLKLKRRLNDDKISKLNEQKQRGDMNPLMSSLPTLIDGKKFPLRGDTVTRNKRSHNDDELWGFAEDEGYVSSDGIETSTAIAINDQPINQLPPQLHENQSTKLNFINEKKLFDYIARNRPIVVPNRSRKNDWQTPPLPYSSRKDQLHDNVYNERHDNVMERKQPSVSVRNYNDLMRMSQEQARINNIPISARIFITRDPSSSSSSSSSVPSTTTLPPFLSRGNFDNDIDFPEINPHRPGLIANNFPTPQTQSPLKTPPDPCVWAIVQCCPNNMDNRRLIKCFEYMNCPGVNWDPNPCRKEIITAAQGEIINYYASAMKQK